MQDIFDISDILYQINHYLSLNEKLEFRLINKHVSYVCKNIMFLHIGQILGNRIGLDKNTYKSDLMIIRNMSLEIIKEIVIYLEPPIVIKPSIVNIPFGVLLRISHTTKEVCIKKLKTKKIFRHKIVTKKYSLESNTIKRYFPNVYPLLLD